MYTNNTEYICKNVCFCVYIVCFVFQHTQYISKFNIRGTCAESQIGKRILQNRKLGGSSRWFSSVRKVFLFQAHNIFYYMESRLVTDVLNDLKRIFYSQRKTDIINHLPFC